MENLMLTSPQICEAFIETGYKKAKRSVFKTLLLGILAGAFIAFAAQGANTATHTISSVGIAKALAGAIFATGLMMVIIAGGELFTGNCLINISVYEGKVKYYEMLRNWIVVYTGNFIGSLIVVFLILYSGQLNFSGGLLGAYTIKVAAYKTSLTFVNALTLGILCNWLVCIAVWMAMGAKDITGKIWAIFFPIWLFITSGFEHSIANMYYIPAGILAKSNSIWVNEAVKLGIDSHKLEALNWNHFFINNLLPVTLGNIIGGAVFVGVMYWVIYLYKEKTVK